MEDVLTTSVNVALPGLSDLPDDLADELSALTMLNDEALRAAAEPSFSLSQQRRLAQLSHAGGTRPLSKAETSELAHLLDLQDRSILLRAQALAILAHRGYDIPNRSDLTETSDGNIEDPETAD